MRLRDDEMSEWWDAGQKRRCELGARPYPDEEPDVEWDAKFVARMRDDAFESAKVGDVWAVFVDPANHRMSTSVLGQHPDWLPMGYVLTCPNEACEQGCHRWTHARDCGFEDGSVGPCKNGGEARVPASCWTWSGSVEAGDLTASPSLFANHAGCGWHGHLVAGVTVPV